MLNDEGEVIRVVHGPVPLWGTRRGEDVMMTNALAFDVRSVRSWRPLFHARISETISSRAMPAGSMHISHADNMGVDERALADRHDSQHVFPYVGQGAYVDLGYGFYPFHGAAPVSDSASPRYARLCVGCTAVVFCEQRSNGRH